MKRYCQIWMLFLAAILPQQESKAADFQIVDQAITAVMKHHFAKRAPEVPFSIAKVFEPRHERFDAIGPALEKAIVSKLGGAAKHYVPLSDLRFPKDNERDPKDPKGETYRGIESAKSGERVYVFYISHIQYVDAKTLHVHYASFNNPLGASSGYYVVRVTKDGFTIDQGTSTGVA